MAAWEIVRRTVDETQETEAVAPHSGSLNRFIGFVEGRLHTNLPAWWKKDMEEARVYNRRFSFCRKLADWPECFMTESGYYAPQDTSVNRVGDDWVVSVGTEACVLPHGLMKSPDLFEVITASISAERCYVAIHEASSMPYLIYCIDRKKKEISWKTDAWVNHQRSRRRYIGFPLLAIKEHKERVFLFGITHYQAYIQCYNRDDGTRIFRFSTW